MIFKRTQFWLMKPEIEDFKTWTVCVKTSNCFTKNIVFQTFQGHRFFREKSPLAPDASSERTVQRPVPSSLSGRFVFSSGICQVKCDVESLLVCCLEGKGSRRLNLSKLAFWTCGVSPRTTNIFLWCQFSPLRKPDQLSIHDLFEEPMCL